MLDLTSEQRQLVLDKLPDAANVALGALGFGPLLSGGSVSFVRVAAGVAIWILIFGFCFYNGSKK